MLGIFQGMIKRLFCTKSTDHIAPEKTYPNTSAHPELQKLDEYGFRSILMKQLEINERILREILAELKRR